MIGGHTDARVRRVEGSDERAIDLPPGYAYPRHPEAYLDQKHIFEDHHEYQYHPTFGAANQLATAQPQPVQQT